MVSQNRIPFPGYHSVRPVEGGVMVLTSIGEIFYPQKG